MDADINPLLAEKQTCKHLISADVANLAAVIAELLPQVSYMLT